MFLAAFLPKPIALDRFEAPLIRSPPAKNFSRLVASV